MANPIAVGNLVLIDVSGTGDLVEYSDEGGYVQQIAPPPGGIGGADWLIAQLGADLLLVPKAAGDILRMSRSGEDLGTFVSAHEFGNATIHMAQVDQQDRLVVLYELADETGTPRIKRFNPDGSLETDFGPLTLADGFHITGNQVSAGISPDGTTVYLAAGQYVEGGNRHIPIVKVTLDADLGVAVVTDRWATAVSGTDSSPGGGAAISGSTLVVDPTSGDVSVVVARRLWPAGTPGSTDLTNGSISVPAHGEITCLYTSTGGSDASLSAPAPGTTITALIVARWANELFNAFMWADGSTTVRAELRLGGATVASFTRNLTFGNNIFGGDWGTLLGEGPFTTHIVNLGDHAVLWQGNDWVITGSAGIPADESTVEYLLHTFDTEGELVSAVALYRAPWELETHRDFEGMPLQVAVDPTDGGCVWVTIPHDEVSGGTTLDRIDPKQGTVTQVTNDLFGDGIAHPNVSLVSYNPNSAPWIPLFTPQLGTPQSQPGTIQPGAVLPPLPIWTGFFWCSPVQEGRNAIAEGKLRDTGRQGAVIVLNSAEPTGFIDACNRIMNARQATGGTSSLDQCVARLFVDAPIRHPTLNDIPTVEAARTWLHDVGFINSVTNDGPLDYFVDNGGRWAVIFNELLTDPLRNPQYNIDQRVMGYLGWALHERYYNSGDRRLFLLFPGPAGLLAPEPDYRTDFDAYWNRYDLRQGAPLVAVTFGQYTSYDPQPSHTLDPIITNMTMLYHNGIGVFDGVAAICYETDLDRYASPKTNDNDTTANLALRVLRWQKENVDPSSPVFVTETAGNPQCYPNLSNCGDYLAAGAGLARFQKLASDQFATPIDPDVPDKLFLRAVYGYILPDSDDEATTAGWHRIGDFFLAGWKRVKEFA
jgi:hypothetical protein